MKECIECGNNLTGNQTKFCSKRCRDRNYDKRHKNHHKVCPECGVEFMGRKDQVYCSNSCSAAYGNRLYTGEKAKNWKGGRIIRKDGYVMIYTPDSPVAHKDGYAYEHRLVANEKYPFTLPSSFPAHHLNGDRSDNRPENIQVRGSQGRHLKEYHLKEGSPGFKKSSPQEG